MTRARRRDWILTIVFLVTCLAARAIESKDHNAEAKDHVVATNSSNASLNETVYHGNELETMNEVLLVSNENDDETVKIPFKDDHPHKMPDKPSKLDLDMNQLVIKDIHRNSEQLESTTTKTSDIPQISVSNTENESTIFCHPNKSVVFCMEQDLSNFLDKLVKVEKYNVTDYMHILRRNDTTTNDTSKAIDPPTDLLDKVQRYAKQHVLEIQLDKSLITGRSARTFFGAFGLKKLLLPLIIGAQIIKSILIALFLPSIIGSIGKIVGKGVSSFAQSSQGATAAPEENFEFKDNVDFYNEDYFTRQPVGTLPASAMYDETMLQPQKGTQEIASRYSFLDPRVPPANALSDRYYTRHVAHNGLSKKQDFKVFHEIPTSSLLLTNYDPFYSPLLSRLDAVFSRLGHTTEGCREYAVCAMYRSPARYAPYSNLVSAQLSRELNELRKPSNDNPDVLRFFRYMKAAKDGQDGVKCENAYSKCAFAREDQSHKQNQAMLATYQDIDKLVQARKINNDR